MRVKILEDEFRHEIAGEGLRVFRKDDELTVPDADGEYFCANGWAQDLEGNVETAERDTNRKVLFVDKVAETTAAGEAQ